MEDEHSWPIDGPATHEEHDEQQQTQRKPSPSARVQIFDETVAEQLLEQTPPVTLQGRGTSDLPATGHAGYVRPDETEGTDNHRGIADVPTTTGTAGRDTATQSRHVSPPPPSLPPPVTPLPPEHWRPSHPDGNLTDTISTLPVQCIDDDDDVATDNEVGNRIRIGEHEVSGGVDQEHVLTTNSAIPLDIPISKYPPPLLLDADGNDVLFLGEEVGSTSPRAAATTQTLTEAAMAAGAVSVIARSPPNTSMPITSPNLARTSMASPMIVASSIKRWLVPQRKEKDARQRTEVPQSHDQPQSRRSHARQASEDSLTAPKHATNSSSETSFHDVDSYFQDGDDSGDDPDNVDMDVALLYSPTDHTTLTEDESAPLLERDTAASSYGGTEARRLSSTQPRRRHPRRRRESHDIRGIGNHGRACSEDSLNHYGSYPPPLTTGKQPSMGASVSMPRPVTTMIMAVPTYEPDDGSSDIGTTKTLPPYLVANALPHGGPRRHHPPHTPPPPQPPRMYTSFSDYIQSHGGITIRPQPAVAAATGESDDEAAMEGTGMDDGSGKRVSYNNFTTIDWRHDAVKERLRLRRLQAQTGWPGRVARGRDALTAWIVVFAVGALIGLMAAAINVLADWLGDLKMGHCRSNVFYSRSICCKGTGKVVCGDWVEWGTVILEGYPTAVPTPSHLYFYTNLIYIGVALLFTSVSASLVQTLAPYAAGSGVPEVKTILGGFIIRRFLGLRTLIAKSIGIPFSVASGMSIGKQGPLVHIACCLGNVFIRLFRKYARNEAKKREILSAASAAGVSVAFGAPIGGVLFSLEEMSYYFPYKTLWRSFFCALVATLVDPFRTGKLVLFQVSYGQDQEWHAFDLVSFALLGVFGGAFGVLFNKMNLAIASMRKHSRLHRFPITEAFLMTIVTGLVNFAFPWTRGSSGQLLAHLFDKCNDESDFFGLCNGNQEGYVAGVLILIAILKTILTTFNFGVKVPGGIFIPSMAIGACIGRSLGIALHAFHRSYPDFILFSGCTGDKPCVVPGTYALVGAAAVLCGVTRMTIALVVIMFELTGALTYVLPTMIAIMFSKWVADAMGQRGLYDGLLKLKNYPYLDAKFEYQLNALSSQVMTPISRLIVISDEDCTVDSLDEMLRVTRYKGFPVVLTRQNPVLLGYIARSELKYAIRQLRQDSRVSGTTPCYFSLNFPRLHSVAFIELRTWLDQTPVTVNPKTSLDFVKDLFQKLGISYTLVTRNGHLLGLITKKDLLRHMEKVRLYHQSYTGSSSRAAAYRHAPSSVSATPTAGETPMSVSPVSSMAGVRHGGVPKHIDTRRRFGRPITMPK